MKRVALIGTGLVGGSVGLALVRAGVEVVGFDRDDARAAAALARGAVTETAAELAMAVVGADLVLVAVPVSMVADVVVAVLDA
ncbi:MAG TPA: prephenate dehydrogenase/arogenate dehydrogenase family protein, partial [Acidimicrobiia bacterium]|nr:prephenate dehydrogenase/arogenate dehydrogenase family protein [Acidimicrobiia bacterium]